MLRAASLQRRNELGRPHREKLAATAVVAFLFLATLFLKNFDSAIKAASVPPRNDVDLPPCPGRSAVRVSANSEQGGRQWR
jgi:hypothetical protein